MVRNEQLIDDPKCYEVVRKLRWSERVRCPNCDEEKIKNTATTTAIRTGNAMIVRGVVSSLTI